MYFFDPNLYATDPANNTAHDCTKTNTDNKTLTLLSDNDISMGTDIGTAGYNAACTTTDIATARSSYNQANGIDDAGKLNDSDTALPTDDNKTSDNDDVSMFGMHTNATDTVPARHTNVRSLYRLSYSTTS